MVSTGDVGREKGRLQLVIFFNPRDDTEGFGLQEQ